MSTRAIGVALAVVVAGPGAAQSLNGFGMPGLIEMPTAETFPDGEIGVTYGRFQGTERSTVSLQFLPRVSGSVRVSSIDDGPGPRRNARGFDLQFQLLREDGLRPAVALGVRDFLGDGPYGAEYLVATKSLPFGLAVSGGIGWGRLGGVGDIGSPFGARGEITDPDGRLQFGTYFQGPAAVFGGVKWQTPLPGVSLLAELSSDAYELEAGGGFERASPFNFGAVYRPNEYLQATVAYLNGDQVGVQLSVTGNPMRPVTRPDLGTGPAPVRARQPGDPTATGWAGNARAQAQLLEALSEVLAADGIVVEEARFTGTEAALYIRNPRIPREPKAVGRTARVLATGLPASVETFRITLVDGGLPTTTVVLQRSDIEAQVDRPDAALRSWRTTRLEDAAARLEDADFRRPLDPRFTWGLSPSVPINLLDADDGLRPDVLFTLEATYRLVPGLSVSGEVSRFLVGTDQETVSTSESDLPRVRSDSDLYFSGRDIEIDRLTADYVFKATPAVYGRATAGILERVFAGVSGEVLWAPVQQPVALGAELNYARQRAFDDPFSLRDYDVVTGHGSIYWDTGWKGVEAQLDVGRYLAGDYGATVSLARRFENGWEMRAFATGTDVGFEEFGDGSFAKGVTISIPLRWGLPFETKSTASASLVPLENDGGARLRVPGRLYDRIDGVDRASLRQGWDTFWQ